MRFKLKSLNESKKDIQKFIDKFGEDTYNLFKKSTERLKNNNISTDILYHVKNTKVEDLEKILKNLESKVITQKNDLTKVDGKYKYLGTFENYDVYDIQNAKASFNFGAGTNWCISGRFNTNTPSLAHAIIHFKDYTKRGIKFCFLVEKGTNNGKYAIAIYPKVIKDIDNFLGKYHLKTSIEIYNKHDVIDYSILNDDLIDFIQDYYTIIAKYIKAENEMVINNGKLISVDKSLQSITIPDSITSIGNRAFYECEKLTDINIPSSVKSIGYKAFYGCTSLTSIHIPNSVESIGENAFYKCYSLEKITIPNSVKSIGDGAFASCLSLKSITLPNSLISIGSSLFSWCRDLINITIPNSVVEISDYAFSNCRSLTNITIPNSVKSIDNCAFSDCISLTSITIPNSVKSIGEMAFAWCTSLKNVNILNPEIKINDTAFSECDSLDLRNIKKFITH